jgi:alpha-amylase
MKKLKFLMAVHSHQPVGNFDHIFEQAFTKAYLPFLVALERHPKIRIALHYSGSLIDWIEIHHPDFISRIHALIKRNQIELLSSGYYEPILALLPDDDKIGQIKLLNKKIEELWGIEPQGIWLTERVWEPTLAKSIADADITYTIVDDAHFEKAGKNIKDLYGYYVSEEEGEVLDIFPGSKFLRYALPFKLPEETINHLRNCLLEGKTAITFADDGEKFGLWPHTHKWVYEEQWLEKFFNAIEENSEWIETVTFSEYINAYPPTERVYLPCASYTEMLEWSDGYFRNFLVRYPEANNMHKRMLEVSRRIAQTDPQNTLVKDARRYLYMAQSNDGYWHGVFGGLYLNHLRYNVYSNLIKAEKILDRIMHRELSWLENHVSDYDYDGADELSIENANIKAYIDLDEKASIFELDYKNRDINLVNTLSRRKEKYHDKIREKILKKSYAVQVAATSIHNLEKNIPEGLEKSIIYDRYRRTCLREAFLRDDVSLDDFITMNFDELDSSHTRYILDSFENTHNKLIVSLKRSLEVDGLPFEAEKFIEIERDLCKFNFKYKITNRSSSSWKGRMGIEFNFSLWDEMLVNKGQQNSIECLKIKDAWFGLGMEFIFDRLTDIWHFPIETVYESESGFEKNFQAMNVFLNWRVNLDSRETWSVNITQDITG